MTTFALSTVAWLAVGGLIGALHFFTLHWNVALLAAGRAPALALGLQLLRLALVGAALAGVAIEGGALPLLLAAAGILAARAVAVRRVARG